MTGDVDSNTTAPAPRTSLPSDPIAAREFLQSRVTRYLKVAFGIWLVAIASDRISKLYSYHDAYLEPVGWYLDAQYVALAMLAAAYIVARRLKLSPFALRAFEVSATLIQALLATSILSQITVAARPEMLSLFAVTLFLVLRAGIVPGTTLVALVVGLLAVTPTLVLTYVLYTTPAAPPPLGITVQRALLYMVEWSAMALFATTAIHSVIYGLQERIQELGQYTLLHKIGEGGMGVVYRARHALLRRPTAVKVLPADRTTPAAIARFEREVQLTAELSHPNIVSVYDFGRTPDGSFYYAMEFLDGVDLQRLIEESGPIAPERAVHMLLQAADALAEAHAVGLIHRDIKPANLFVSNLRRRPDHVTVLDFGLAKDYTSQGSPELSAAESLTGTPLYMAPESIVSPAEVDARSDIYALGAVAYWLLTGTPPFSGRSIVEVCAAHLHTAVERPSERRGVPIGDALDALVLDCLAKSKTDRPTSAAVLVERLRALPVTSWTASDAEREWAQRRTRVPTEPREPIALARTLAIAKRAGREDDPVLPRVKRR